jgi:hypothetical protein
MKKIKIILPKDVCIEDVIECFGGLENLPNWKKLVEEDGWYIWLTHHKEYGLHQEPWLHTEEDFLHGGRLIKRPQWSLNVDKWVECDCGDYGEATDAVLSKLGIEYE